VRQLIKDSSACQGLNVLSGTNPEEALAAAHKHNGPIHLLLADAAMPNGDGVAFCRRFAQEHPEAACRLLVEEAAGVDFPLPVLRKPLTADDLTREVRRALISSPFIVGSLHSPGMPRILRQEMQEEVEHARSEWLVARAEFNEVLAEIPSGIPHPDGSLRIRRAGAKQLAAFRKYRGLLQRCRDFT
jgi:CheY-like chemotaxis protein